jgi:AcrR family transcriptional regulator
LSRLILKAVSVVDRPLRADARRNREQILKAAKAVFAKYGNDAQMDDIARRAKVGVGTLYRHFPTKDALIRALVADRVATVAGFVREALEDSDPFNGLCHSMWRSAELAATDRGLTEIFGERHEDLKEAHAAREDLTQAAGELIRRAREEGSLRPDFSVEDIPVVMCGVMSAINQMRGQRWQRHVRLIFDGMRARPDLEPLPGG